MKRSATVVAIALLVVGAALAVPMAAGAQSVAADNAQANSVTNDLLNTTEANVSANETISPGERLSAVVSAQEAEIGGDVEVRTFGIRIAQNESDAARSAVVADQLAQVRERLQDLEQQRSQLQAARENGSMSGGEYAARASSMATQAENARELLNRTEDVASGLPADLLESKGINVSAIQTLKTEASELSGSEVARLARQIAGSDMGQQMRPDGVGDRSPADDRGPADDETERPGNGQDGERPGTAQNVTDGNETSSPEGTMTPPVEDSTTVSDGETTTSPGNETTRDGSAVGTS